MSSQPLAPSSREPQAHPQRQSIPAQAAQLDPKSICRDLASSIDSFDFESFFEAFPIDSVVSKFIESFSLPAFHELMVRAFTDVPLSEYGSPHAREVRVARHDLEQELRHLDVLLGLMEEARLNVQGVRASLHWVRSVNQRLLDRDSLAQVVRSTSPVHPTSTVGDLHSHTLSTAVIQTLNSPPREGYLRTPLTSSPGSQGPGRYGSLQSQQSFPGTPRFSEHREHRLHRTIGVSLHYRVVSPHPPSEPVAPAFQND